MFINPNKVKMETPAEIIYYVNGGLLVPRKSSMEVILKPLKEPNANRSLLSDSEVRLYETYDKIPNDSKPLFGEIVQQVYETRRFRQTLIFVAGGAAILALVAKAFFSRD